MKIWNFALYFLKILFSVDDSVSDDSSGPINDAVNASVGDHLDKSFDAGHLTFVPTTSRNPVW